MPARHAVTEHDFHRRLAADEVGYAEIAVAQADGTLTPARALALKGDLERREATRAEQEEKIGRAVAVLRDGGTFDPHDPGQRGVAETLFEKLIAPQLEGLPAKDRIAFLEGVP